MKFFVDVMPQVTDEKSVCNFPNSAVPTREFLKVVRWNGDDAIAHDPLRLRITNLT
jgi:hypothetical protein